MITDSPNLFIAFGHDDTFFRPESEIICTSHIPDDNSFMKYNIYCETDGQRDFALGLFGGVLVTLKDRQGYILGWLKRPI